MCAPSAPPATDYAAQASAQGAANKDAAVAQSRLNNPNVVNPYGTQTYTENPTQGFDQANYDAAVKHFQDTGEGAMPDRAAFVTQEPGRPTLTQQFSPEQQQLYQQSTQVKNLLGGLGIQGATALGDVVGKNLDLSSAPSVGSYDSTRQKVMDAMMGRANEDYGKQTDQTNSDLIAAGIRPGTKAYADRMQMIERSRNDARSQAEIAAGNATSQAFNTDTQRRKDAIAELLAQRQTPLNEINALMSGSQVSNPFAVPGVAQNTNVAPSPIFGAAQAQDQSATGLYNADAARASSTTNAALGIAGTAAMMMF
jgi:hypothetical protein